MRINSLSLFSAILDSAGENLVSRNKRRSAAATSRPFASPYSDFEEQRLSVGNRSNPRIVDARALSAPAASNLLCRSTFSSAYIYTEGSRERERAQIKKTLVCGYMGIKKNTFVCVNAVLCGWERSTCTSGEYTRAFCRGYIYYNEATLLATQFIINWANPIADSFFFFLRGERIPYSRLCVCI